MIQFTTLRENTEHDMIELNYQRINEEFDGMISFNKTQNPIFSYYIN